MAVTDEIRDHQARCAVPLNSLRMLAHDDGGAPVPRRVVVEIAQATRAVLAEAEAAGRVVVAPPTPGAVILAAGHSSRRGWTGWRPRPTTRSPRHERGTSPR